MKMNELKNLVDVDEVSINKIMFNCKNNGIELLDFAEAFGLKITNETSNSIRSECIKKYRKLLLGLRTIDYNLTDARVNYKTEFENKPNIFFGVGGGSKAICKGLPFDILIMILTAEKIRREMGLGKCNILLANRITYTNIPRNPEFTKESIDNVMSVEKEIIDLVLKKFNLSENFNLIMQTEMNKFLSKKDYENYEKIIQIGDKSKVVGGHHYAIEMADINAMVGLNSGGIKLGWFIRNIDKKNGGYIMDEQPFHARFVLFSGIENIENKVSLAYALAGTRIYAGKTGALEKSSPYICYYPEKRILLSPYEDIIHKMKVATLSNNGFEYEYVRKFFGGIVDLFEELVLGKNSDGRINRIQTINNQSYRGEGIAVKMQYILDYIYNDVREEYCKIWDKAFKYKGSDYLNV